MDKLMECERMTWKDEIKKRSLMTMGPRDFITATLFHDYGITQEVIEMVVDKILSFNASEDQLRRAMNQAYREKISPIRALSLIVDEEAPV